MKIYNLAQWVAGELPGGPTYFIGRFLFLRLLGLTYLVAFLSLLVQSEGLWGKRGLLPVHEYLGALRRKLGVRRFWRLPTILWLGEKTLTVSWVCSLGIIFSCMLIAGLFPLLSLMVLWFLYLSLVNVGRDFLAFQWDILLLETGLAAIFLAPPDPYPFWHEVYPVPSLAMGLQWWILFRLMFESGVVKISCGDDCWWPKLTALQYHYETQPLPTRLAHWAHRLPSWFQRASVLAVLFIELVLPFFIFLPPPFRHGAAFAFIFFQVLIALSGNYTFFNFLTTVLSLTLLEDAFWERILPASLSNFFLFNFAGQPEALSVPIFILVLLCGFSLVVFFIGSLQILASLFPDFPLYEGTVGEIMSLVQPIHAVNSYGLFRVMTRTRNEIVIEGSMDGKRWGEYEFKYRPGRMDRPPPWVAPHQPRLDWQMWFAALGSLRQNFWLQTLLVRLLENAPEVLGLLGKNPFPGEPPRFIRAKIYGYRFTDKASRSASGSWWVRQDEGAIYAPVMFLQPPADLDKGPGKGSGSKG